MFTNNRALMVVQLLFGFLMWLGANTSHAGAYEDFFKALEVDDVAVVKRLMSQGFDVNTPGPNGMPPLSQAIIGQSEKSLQVIAQAKDINFQQADRNGDTPLMHAANKGLAATVQLLIGRGAEVNKEGWTPLHYAAAAGHNDVIKLLLDASAYIDAASPNGTTPLMMAARFGHEKTASLLLAEGADPTIVSESGYNAAGYAMKTGHKDFAQTLLVAARDFKKKYYTPRP